MLHATAILVTLIWARRLGEVIVRALAVAGGVVDQTVVRGVADGDLRVRTVVGEGRSRSSTGGSQGRQGRLALMSKSGQPGGLLGESSPVFGLHQFGGELMVEDGDTVVEIRRCQINGRGRIGVMIFGIVVSRV